MEKIASVNASSVRMTMMGVHMEQSLMSVRKAIARIAKTSVVHWRKKIRLHAATQSLSTFMKRMPMETNSSDKQQTPMSGPGKSLWSFGKRNWMTSDLMQSTIRNTKRRWKSFSK